MNHSLYSADRATHSKIVVAALFAAIVITGLVTAVRLGPMIATGESIAVVKAGKWVAVSDSNVAVKIR